jgi:hypothetical protein
MVRCTAGHWRREHIMNNLPEDIAQTCPHFDDMTTDPGQA